MASAFRRHTRLSERYRWVLAHHLTPHSEQSPLGQRVSGFVRIRNGRPADKQFIAGQGFPPALSALQVIGWSPKHHRFRSPLDLSNFFDVDGEDAANLLSATYTSARCAYPKEVQSGLLLVSPTE